MIIGLSLADVPAFNNSIDEIGIKIGVDVFGPYLVDFDSAQYSCGNMSRETVTQLKIVFPNMKVIEHA